VPAPLLFQKFHNFFEELEARFLEQHEVRCVPDQHTLFDWSVDKVVAVGDGATGTNELSRLYAEMKSTPVMTDLQDLFINLGVRAHGGKIDFDDNAPLADIRRGITAPPTQP